MKEKLIEKALELYNSYGYENVSINMICEKCGVTKGSFYHHFTSKNDLLFTYVENIIDENNEKLSFNEKKTYIENIYEAYMSITRPLMDLRSDIIIVLINSHQFSQKHRIYDDYLFKSDFYKKLIAICVQGQKKGEIRDSFKAKDLIKLTSSILTGNFYEYALNDKNYNLSKEDKKAIDIILKK